MSILHLVRFTDSHVVDLGRIYPMCRLAQRQSPLNDLTSTYLAALAVFVACFYPAAYGKYPTSV